jgi:CRP-like cAMP-binding protein
MSTKPTSEPCGGRDDRLPTAETPDIYGAYPRLSDGQIASLAALGQRRSVQPTEVLFREGERDCDFFVVLAGTVAVVEGRGTPEERVISVHGPGRFLGELSLLTGEGSFYAAVATDAGEVLAVPVDRLRELVARDPALGDLVLRAYLIRRSILIGLGAGLRIVGSMYSPDARRLRDFAARNRIPSRWLDLETDPGAEALLSQLGVAPSDTPIVIVQGRLLRNPGNAELASAIGLPAPTASAASCDLLVVGAGPAGLSAAVYGASEGMETVVLDGTATGGQAGTAGSERPGAGSARAAAAGVPGSIMSTSLAPAPFGVGTCSRGRCGCRHYRGTRLRGDQACAQAVMIAPASVIAYLAAWATVCGSAGTAWFAVLQAVKSAPYLPQFPREGMRGRYGSRRQRHKIRSCRPGGPAV